LERTTEKGGETIEIFEEVVFFEKGNIGALVKDSPSFFLLQSRDRDLPLDSFTGYSCLC
jgi:hypothetical protein